MGTLLMICTSKIRWSVTTESAFVSTNCYNCIVFSLRVNTLPYTERNIKKVNNWKHFVNKTNCPTVTGHLVYVCYFLYSTIYRSVAGMENYSSFNIYDFFLTSISQWADLLRYAILRSVFIQTHTASLL